ncbi:MAG TPA: fibronectin type III domain-containing protein [Candidatus Acidoferrum sp.]
MTDTTHGTISAIYYALNVAAGTTVVHVNVTGHNADFVSAVVSEFNNVANANAFDASSGAFSTSTSINSGSLTTSTAGDLIYQYAAGDSGSGTTWSQGSAPWNLLSADYSGSQAAQYQVQASAGSINPTMAISPSTGWGSVAIALKSAAAGTALPAGIRVLRLVHFNGTNETSGTMKFQFPTLTGNLIVMAFSSGVYYPTSLSDSRNNTYTNTGVVVTTDPCIRIFHAASAVGDPALVVTANMTGSVSTGAGGTFFAYEIVGAAPNPLDTTFGTAGFAGAHGNQDEVAGSGPVPTFTATPSGPNELVIVVGSMAADTATGWSSPSGAQQIATTFSGEPNPTNADENNPAGLFYNGANVAAQTWSFTHDTYNHPGVGAWAVGGAAFQAAATGVTPPTTPGNLTATAISSSQINLSWTASTDPAGITGYIIELCQGTGCTAFGRIAAPVGTATTYNDLGLSPSTTYSYRVWATDAAGNASGYSNIATATTPSTAPTFTAPANLTATAASNSQINLSWTPATETGGTISKYLIERCTGTTCSSFAQVGTSATITFADTSLLSSSSYTYRVRAADASNNFSGYSNSASATTASPTLTAPANLTATAASGTQINLSWSASKETGGTIFNYLIERCSGAACANFVQVATAPTTTFTDTGLLPSTSYSYRVRATDAPNNTSAYSNTASATTLAAALIVPPAISFIQLNSANPQSPQSTVRVRFNLAQRVGDLNVVVVGWNDSTCSVNSVVDSLGNVYSLAVGPTVQSGTATQSIYYAKNILAASPGANTVTVNFNGSAGYADIRILEYSGLDTVSPLDGNAAASGSGMNASSGALTTTYTTDLIIGANLVQTGTAGAGTGFTKRIITDPDSDIVEDCVTSALGSYNVASPMTSSAKWIMQAVAFKAHP